MDRQLVKTGSNEKAPSSAELLRQISTQMSEAAPWSERFGKLARSIAEVGNPESQTSLITCRQSQENLELLVTGEIAGLDVRQRYSTLIAHLAECRNCQIAYSLLRGILRAEREERLMPVPTSLPVSSHLPLSGKRAPWRRQSGQSPSPFPLTFHIAREFISMALRGPQLAFVRGEVAEEEERETLLLADMLPTEQGDLVAEVTIHQRVDQVDAIDLKIQLASDWILPDGLWVNLSWAGIQCSEPVTSDGKVSFHNLPLSSLTEQESDKVKADLTLAFVCN